LVVKDALVVKDQRFLSTAVTAASHLRIEVAPPSTPALTAYLRAARRRGCTTVGLHSCGPGSATPPQRGDEDEGEGEGEGEGGRQPQEEDGETDGCSPLSRAPAPSSSRRAVSRGPRQQPWRQLAGGGWVLPRRTVLLMPSETLGIPGALLAELDELVAVPPPATATTGGGGGGGGLSGPLQPQVAASIVLWEFCKQHRLQ
jgi:hypothetical protein